MVNPEPVKANNSGNVWKWIGCGCGGAVLLGIGLIVALGYVVKQTLNMSLDPKKAEETAQSIMDYKIPGGSQGLMTMNLRGVEIAMVTSASKRQEVMLMVGQMPQNLAGDSAQMQKSLENSLEKQTTQQFKSTSKRVDSKQLCGQPVKVTVSEGEMTAVGQTDAVPALSYQAIVSHNNKMLFVQVMTSGEKASSKAAEVFNSLQCK